MFIVISLALFLVMAFAVGITTFRQTKAIWKMNSTNAVTINNTLNTFTAIEPVLVLVAVIVGVLALASVSRGFGGSER